MGSKEIGDRASSFHQGNGNGSCCPSSSSVRRPPSDSVADMSIWPESIFRPPNGMDPFWDPGQFPSPMMLENQATGTGSSCHFLGLPELLPNIPPNFSDMIATPYPLNQPENFHPNQGLDSLESSPNGKRKRKMDSDGEALDNIGQSPTSNQAGKQGKDHSNRASESSKENYIHVRAKRGKATNSHSLAERVRREKISERMKLLQELVPGCNKISGKAVMLDEIINYVQSLQQQVEFLSMELATVNPELNKDIENMSKDILRSQCGSNATAAMAALGIGSEVRCSHPFEGLPLEAIHGFPGSAPPFHQLPQRMERQAPGILQMGYESNPSPLSGLEPNSSGLSVQTGVVESEKSVW